MYGEKGPKWPLILAPFSTINLLKYPINVLMITGLIVRVIYNLTLMFFSF